MARLGDISYSLYLVHWPLLAFAANAWVSTPPLEVRLALVLVAVALSQALFRWVERPMRQAVIPFNRLSLTVALGCSAAVVLVGLLVYQMEYASGRSKLVESLAGRGPTDWGARCEYGDHFSPRPQCQNSDAPRILIWGDSYAMHLVEGLAGSTELGFVQATKTTCGPFLGVSVFRDHDDYNRRWAEDCLAFNQSVLNWLDKASTVDVVVLSSFLGQYLAGNRLLARAAEGGFLEREGGDEIALQSLRETIAAARAMGKRVVLVAPPPVAAFNVGRCLELKGNGKVVFGADHPNCEISEASYRESRANVLAFLDRVERAADVPVVHLDELLCLSGRCAVQIGGYFLYHDNGHLSYDGSRLLGQQLGLADRLMAVAR